MEGGNGGEADGDYASRRASRPRPCRGYWRCTPGYVVRRGTAGPRLRVARWDVEPRFGARLERCGVGGGGGGWSS